MCSTSLDKREKFLQSRDITSVIAFYTSVLQKPTFAYDMYAWSTWSDEHVSTTRTQTNSEPQVVGLSSSIKTAIDELVSFA